MTLIAGQVSLTPLWSYELDYDVEGLALSEEGEVGAVSNYCAYVFDPYGSLLNKVCANDWVPDISYCCGKFAFISWDNYAYVLDKSGNLLDKFHAGYDYFSSITVYQDGYMVCDGECTLFDLNGEELWKADIGSTTNNPSYYQGYWYVADWLRDELIIIGNGTILKEMRYIDYESPTDTEVCGKYLAVGASWHLYLYDLSDPLNPNELWNVRVDGEQVAFSPDCKYIAVADRSNRSLKIFDINGNLVLNKEYNHYGNYSDEVVAVSWEGDRLAVGLKGGMVYVYEVEIAETVTTSSSPALTTSTSSVAITSSSSSTTTSYENATSAVLETSTVTREVTETVTETTEVSALSLLALALSKARKRN